MNLKEETIWIAGHTGMVGQALCKKLAGFDVITVTRKNLDLRDERAVNKWMQEYRPSVIILAAARVGGIKANAENPVAFLLDNLKIQNSVLQAAAQNGVKRLLFLGSACSYPRKAEMPIKEKFLMQGEPEPTNIWYATAKIAGIKLAQALRQENKLDTIVAMPTNAYGPGDNFSEEGHVIPALIKRFDKAYKSNKKKVTIWGTGKPLREFLYVDDLAEALIFLLKNYHSSEPINVGSSTEISIFELAKLVANITNFKGNIEMDASKPDGVPRKLLDSNRIKSLGWKASTALDYGIKETYLWAKLKKII